MILQLNPTIPLDTPKGPGLAILVETGSELHHLVWTVIINDTGEIWSFENPQVKADKNITMGIRTHEEKVNSLANSILEVNKYGHEDYIDRLKEYEDL